jgi:hypothetical protein
MGPIVIVEASAWRRYLRDVPLTLKIGHVRTMEGWVRVALGSGVREDRCVRFARCKIKPVYRTICVTADIRSSCDTLE